MLCWLSESCKKEQNCPGIVCNTGTLDEETCLCDCPEGYSGINCEEENLCITQEVDCQNGGTCADGICNCPEGFTGAHCELLDSNRVEFLLEQGYTPKEIYNGGVPLRHIYGKPYQQGLVCYVDIHDEYPGLEGLVAWPKKLGGLPLEWGCSGENLSELADVQVCPDSVEAGFLGSCFSEWWLQEDYLPGARIGDGAQNTDIMVEAMCEKVEDLPWRVPPAEVCRLLGPEWHLPSRGELIKVYTNLIMEGHGAYDTSDPFWSSTEYNDIWVWSLHVRDNIYDRLDRSSKKSEGSICAVKYF